MKKCLKLSLDFAGDMDFVHSLQKIGAKLSMEGSIKFYASEKQLRIIACGTKEDVDKFLDILHKEVVKIGAPAINIEPFMRDKDYRGVFRIIE